MQLQNDLWRYALDLYQQPGVEQGCLDLQQQGASINRLLFCCWLGKEKRILVPDLVTASFSAQWQQEITHPLRQLRYRVREQKDGRSELDSVYQKMRAAELAAEQVELAALAELAEQMPQQKSDVIAALENLSRYFEMAGLQLNNTARQGLWPLLRAAACHDQQLQHWQTLASEGTFKFNEPLTTD